MDAVPILLKKKLRPREVKLLAQCHSGGMREPGFEIGSVTSKVAA